MKVFIIVLSLLTIDAYAKNKLSMDKCIKLDDEYFHGAILIKKYESCSMNPKQKGCENMAQMLEDMREQIAENNRNSEQLKKCQKILFP